MKGVDFLGFSTPTQAFLPFRCPLSTLTPVDDFLSSTQNFDSSARLFSTSTSDPNYSTLPFPTPNSNIDSRIRLGLRISAVLPVRGVIWATFQT